MPDKKKLAEWKSEFEDVEFAKLEQKLQKEDAEKTYELEELKALLQTTEQSWISKSWEWTKENWLPLLIVVIAVAFVIYILKSLLKGIFSSN